MYIYNIRVYLYFHVKILIREFSVRVWHVKVQLYADSEKKIIIGQLNKCLFYGKGMVSVKTFVPLILKQTVLWIIIKIIKF